MPSTPYNFRGIFKNFFSLNLLQLSNVIFPLIILPYVVRIIGVEKFGLVNFVQAFIMYFVIISDYGFNLSGTREISLYRNNLQKISEIFSSIIILKLILGLFCVFVLFIMVFSFDLFRTNWILYLISTGILFGSIFFPHWFFQGIEKMGIIPLINISIRTLQIVLIFLLVKVEANYILYLLLLSITQLFVGIVGLWVSIYHYKVKIIFPEWNSLLHYLKTGFNLFSASIGMNLFTNSNAFVLGILAGDYSVGIFSAADKIRLTITSLITSFTMSAYPKAVMFKKEIKSLYIDFIKKMLRFSLLLGLGLSLLLFIFAKDVILILFGNKFIPSINLIQLFSVIPFIASIGIVYRVLVLVALGYDSSFTKIILTSVIIHLFLLFSLTIYLNVLGTVYAVIVTETLITLLSIFIVFRKKLL